jgi:hypothetical protein
MGLLAVVLAVGLVLTGCPTGDDGGGYSITGDSGNIPSSGAMSPATAKLIFDYSEVEGGVQIDKFKNTTALQTYLSITRAASGSLSLKLGKIGVKAIVKIAANAFNPDEPGVASLSTAGVVSVELPETLINIINNAFKGTGVIIIVPQEVKDAIGDQITDLETESGVSTEVALKEYPFPDVYNQLNLTVAITVNDAPFTDGNTAGAYRARTTVFLDSECTQHKGGNSSFTTTDGIRTIDFKTAAYNNPVRIYFGVHIAKISDDTSKDTVVKTVPTGKYIDLSAEDNTYPLFDIGTVNIDYVMD